jgi:glyoxylase-like metal-dependent hydrolase (beta-lactamase superfamily II)
MRTTMVAIALAAITATLAAQGTAVVRTADPSKRGFKDSDFPRVVKLTDNVYAYEDLRSAGTEKFTTTNLFVVTREGVLIADGQGNAAATKGLVDAIARITPQPIKYVVICSDHGDHTAGNASFPADVTYIVHPTSKATLEAQAAASAARGNAAAAAGAWRLPASAEVVAGEKTLTLGAEEIQILFLGRAHTGGDLSVYLPRERILFMSEAYLNRVFPAMRSAYPSEWKRVLEKAEAMRVDRYVPGHGFTEDARVSREELVNYRKALEAVIAEATRLHAAGLPVDEAVKQAKFGEYDGWAIAAQQGPIAVRKVYEELDGKLK